jgi:hypothetical protein
MEKTILIDGKNVSFKANAATLLKYKLQTGRELLSDFAKLSEFAQKQDYTKLDSTVLYDIIWVCAKQADQTIPSAEVWLDSFENFPLLDILPDIITLISNTLSVKIKN